MDYNRDYFPGDWEGQSPTQGPAKKRPGGVSFGALISVVCIAVAIAVLLTFVVTSAANRYYYSQELARQQEVIDQLRGTSESTGVDFEQLEMLSKIYEHYSYYAGKVSEEELLTAVMKAYAEATGDAYAEYYTEEEFEALTAEREGARDGIGVSVIQTQVTVAGADYAVFQIIAIYEGGPAASSSLRVGDYINSVKTDGVYRSVSELGYTKALDLMQGESGTQAEFTVFRAAGNGYESLPFSITRGAFESRSVTYRISKTDPTVGIVHISTFDMTTPTQFKEAVKSLQADGIARFVFDLRNNPGGELQSIKAVLTYFLQEGDLILSAIDREGRVSSSYVAEEMRFEGDYEPCNVARGEIGMFADLDMVVLCNENTASAAEVFTATLRDYELATVVGETTFGKGIMQSFIPLSVFGNYKGYAKMTTYAYVTKCGVTYHEIGITPHVQVSLSPEALQYNFYVLPEELDDQLQAAVAHLTQN